MGDIHSTDIYFVIIWHAKRGRCEGWQAYREGEWPRANASVMTCMWQTHPLLEACKSAPKTDEGEIEFDEEKGGA